MANTDEKGYGRFRYSYERRGTQAHRVSLILTCGYEVPGAQVLHSCDNPGCVEPTHLRWGTGADNMADRMAREGYQASKKLNTDQVTEIKILLREGKQSRRAIAKQYGVVRQVIDSIANGTTWRYVE